MVCLDLDIRAGSHSANRGHVHSGNSHILAARTGAGAIRVRLLLPKQYIAVPQEACLTLRCFLGSPPSEGVVGKLDRGSVTAYNRDKLVVDVVFVPNRVAIRTALLDEIS